MIIAARFNGPPHSGNGGYSSGTFAALVPVQAATVTLRRPVPLDTELTARRTEDEVEVWDGDRLIATVAPADVPLHVVPGVPVDEARQAMTRYAGLSDHPFPTCYACGTQRDDGLRLAPGPIAAGRTASVWRVPEDVTVQAVWATLDCTGGWAINSPGRRYVLGRMTAAVTALPSPGAQCVVVGQAVSAEGRKAQVRSAVYGPDGEPIARSTATWISI